MSSCITPLWHGNSGQRLWTWPHIPMTHLSSWVVQLSTTCQSFPLHLPFHHLTRVWWQDAQNSYRCNPTCLSHETWLDGAWTTSFGDLQCLLASSRMHEQFLVFRSWNCTCCQDRQHNSHEAYQGVQETPSGQTAVVDFRSVMLEEEIDPPSFTQEMKQ